MGYLRLVYSMKWFAVTQATLNRRQTFGWNLAQLKIREIRGGGSKKLPDLQALCTPAKEFNEET